MRFLPNAQCIEFGLPGGPVNDRRTIVTFAVVALLILAMAAINFINLATARASQRAREVALRKVLGARRRQLVIQFLAESLLLTGVAMLIALALVELLLPMFGRFLNAEFELHYLGEGGMLQYEYHTAGSNAWGYWLHGHTALLWVWAAMLTALTAVYAWATMAFGIRFSNLTYRGVLTNGPYRFTRHPAYLSKNLFWWFSAMPFLVTTGSAAEAVRNTVFLGCVSAIYFARAKTEEAHLLAEDDKYRDYHSWMAVHGPITGPMSRLLSKLKPRRMEPEPAE